MSPTVADLPPDVLLELAKELDVADLLGFLSVCRVIRELQFQRTLWLNAIARIKEVENHPLPVSDSEVLETLSLPELQGIVRQANRLVNNFKSDRPRPFCMRTFRKPWEKRLRIILIQGTNLLVTHGNGSVSCWDIPTSQRLGHLEVPGLCIKTQEPCMEIEGKALLGGYIESAQCLVAIYIDYTDRAHTSISYVTSPPTPKPHHFLFWPFFGNSRILGFCTTSSIVSWCIDAAIDVKEISQEFTYRRGLSCLPFGQGLYIFFRGSISTEAAAQVLPLPPISDEHHQNPPLPLLSTTVELPLHYPFASSQHELSETVDTISFHPTHMFPPDYGVFATTYRAFQWEGRQTSVVHFWPGRPVSGGIKIGQGHFYKHTDSIHATAVGASGRYMLILHRGEYHPQDNSYEGEGHIGLLHFIPTPTPHITFRKLDIGELSPRLVRTNRVRRLPRPGFGR
ncbi:F-box domain-containing protein [Mycena venus]|uniref:F-box domain-containing protein n=1 Tax=Mycena venus TaxID=2733690 RepID=A0A8H6X7F9_9AGAR|nr:F-box domain-containing protein [Mycena venus]